MATDTTARVKTRFCMISDTHSFAPAQPENPSTPFRRPLPSADVLLHAGDLTMLGRDKEHRTTVDMLKEANAELKIVIAGNHDITLDEQYYLAYGHARHHGGLEDTAKIRDLYCGEEARQHGIVYMDEGLRTFRLKNGAYFTVYASPYQPEFCHWAFAYDRDQDRFNPPEMGEGLLIKNLVPSFPDVHVMLTHGPPYGILDRVYPDESVGCTHLRRAVERAKPLIHCFGHIHEGHGAMRVNWSERTSQPIPHDRDSDLQNRCASVDLSSDSEDPIKFGEETLFVNAAVMTVKYRPINAPWVADIDLPITPLTGQEHLISIC